MPGCGGTVRLPRLIGKKKAIEMILRGEMVSAEQAFGWGLIDAFVEKTNAVDAAIALIKRLSSGTPLSFGGERNA
jgi:enoyl-CoA hydratase/carnithine racemase